MSADQIEILQSIKEAVDAYAETFDPCNMCKKLEDDMHSKECHHCCFFYASQFDPKENK